MYDPEVSPGEVVDWDTRRDDEEESSRRSPRATKVTTFTVDFFLGFKRERTLNLSIITSFR